MLYQVLLPGLSAGLGNSFFTGIRSVRVPGVLTSFFSLDFFILPTGTWMRLGGGENHLKLLEGLLYTWHGFLLIEIRITLTVAALGFGCVAPRVLCSC